MFSGSRLTGGEPVNKSSLPISPIFLLSGKDGQLFNHPTSWHLPYVSLADTFTIPGMQRPE